MLPRVIGPSNRQDTAVQSDLEYFRGRAQDEIDASLAAESTPARQAHLELAYRYAELADAIEQSMREAGIGAAAEARPAIA